MVKELMCVLDLVDTWWSSNPRTKKYTWINGTKPVKMARFDFLIVYMDIQARTVITFMSFGYRTDHSFIGVKINIEDTNRGKGFGNLTIPY